MAYGVSKLASLEPEKQRPAKRPRVQVQAATEDAPVSDGLSPNGDSAQHVGDVAQVR